MSNWIRSNKLYIENERGDRINANLVPAVNNPPTGAICMNRNVWRFCAFKKHEGCFQLIGCYYGLDEAKKAIDDAHEQKQTEDTNQVK